MLRPMLLAIAVLFLGSPATRAEDQTASSTKDTIKEAPTNACTAANLHDIQAALPKEPTAPLYRYVSIAPADGRITIVLNHPYKEGELSYRILMFRNSPPSVLTKNSSSDSTKDPSAGVPENAWDIADTSGEAEGAEILASALPDADALRKAATVDPKATALSFTIPGLTAHWGTGLLTVIGCDQKLNPVFVGSAPLRYSNRWISMAVAAASTVILYILIATAVWGVEKGKKTGTGILSWRRYLDPVVLSSGPNGKGSISRLQILFFSVIVFTVLLYIVLRVGKLSDMSNTVLLLLGISGVGTAAAKATDVSLNRLESANWSWLVQKGWLPPNGLLEITKAQWKDIVTGDDGFDVYHFQMLVFSLVVGLALLMTGFTDLATFEVPETLLGVLGLSQAVYVGGKLVSDRSCSDLNEAVTKLRALEDEFAQAVIAASPPALVPTTLQQAIPLARKQYDSFKKQLSETTPLFKSVIGEFFKQPNQIVEPRLPV